MRRTILCSLLALVIQVRFTELEKTPGVNYVLAAIWNEETFAPFMCCTL